VKIDGIFFKLNTVRYMPCHFFYIQQIRDKPVLYAQIIGDILDFVAGASLMQIYSVGTHGVFTEVYEHFPAMRRMYGVHLKALLAEFGYGKYCELQEWYMTTFVDIYKNLSCYCIRPLKLHIRVPPLSPRDFESHSSSG
jgi:hypothetical protein